MSTLKLTYGWLAATALLMLQACSVIDDDLGQCDTGYRLDYELQLVTNMTTELQTELTTQTDLSVANALRTHLGSIFTDHAHDVDLSFYDTQDDSLRLYHDSHVMDAAQASYTLFLPMRRYMHLTAANVVDNPVVELHQDEACHQAVLQQASADTVPSHTTGVFTARQHMDVLEGVSQHFDVHLYMANCAAALVVDTVGSGIRHLTVTTAGFATAFAVADSLYRFAAPSPVVRAQQVDTGTTGGPMTFCSVNFPSAETAPAAPAPTRTVIETTDPFTATGQGSGLWQYQVCATCADGTVTRSELSVQTPLRAGQLKVVKAKVRSNGALGTDDQTVAVSVQLDWNAGGSHDITL